jgi:hypothetical protein
MSQNAALYDEDFFAWTVDQAWLLRAAEWSALDVANLAEEIESMGRSVRRELRSRLIVLLTHMLKWGRQTAARSCSWSSTIDGQRLQVKSLLTESPSLGRYWRACLGTPIRLLDCGLWPRPGLPSPNFRRRVRIRSSRSCRTRFFLTLRAGATRRPRQ